MFKVRHVNYETGVHLAFSGTKSFRTFKAAENWVAKNQWLFSQDIGTQTKHRILVEIVEEDVVKAAYMSVVQVTTIHREWRDGEKVSPGYIAQRIAVLIMLNDETARRVREGISPLIEVADV